MMDEQHKMKSIWFFVGLTLLAMGAMVFLAGVLMLFSPPGNRSVLFRLRPNLWWGGIMMLVGLMFLVFEARKKDK